jgi:hypothetical protein
MTFALFGWNILVAVGQIMEPLVRGLEEQEATPGLVFKMSLMIGEATRSAAL